MARLTPIFVATEPFHIRNGSESLRVIRFGGTEWNGHPAVVPVFGIKIVPPDAPHLNHVSHYAHPVFFGDVIACKQAYHCLKHFDEYFIEEGADERSVRRLLRAVSLIVSTDQTGEIEQYARFLAPYFRHGKVTIGDYREYVKSYRPDQASVEALIAATEQRGGRINRRELSHAITRGLIQHTPLIERVLA